MRHDKGDRVVATKDIGGLIREHVPKGSEGVVTEAGLMRDTKVLFTVKGPLGGKKQIKITVQDEEIA